MILIKKGGKQKKRGKIEIILSIIKNKK